MSIRAPYIYGEILSRTYLSEENELPGFGSFLWQGATVGALLAFFIPVAGLLAVDPYYGILFIGALPRFLAEGIGFGVLEGVIIWACTFLTGRRLNVFVRAAIGVVVLNLLLLAVQFLFFGPSPYAKVPSTTDYLFNIGIYVACGMIFGLVIGSRFDPLHELIRGTKPPRWSVLAAITGFALRVAVILFLMYSVLILVWTLRGNFHRKELTFAVIAVSHFAAAAIILFARMPFWLLLPLAIIVDFPIVAFITDVLTEQHALERNFVLVYLHLWAAFLICRFSVPQRALSLE